MQPALLPRLLREWNLNCESVPSTQIPALKTQQGEDAEPVEPAGEELVVGA